MDLVLKQVVFLQTQYMFSYPHVYTLSYNVFSTSKNSYKTLGFLQATLQRYAYASESTSETKSRGQKVAYQVFL